MGGVAVNVLFYNGWLKLFVPVAKLATELQVLVPNNVLVALAMIN
jgi:hypothetical protein